MSRPITILPFFLILTSAALAQTNTLTPNAIGLWRSDSTEFVALDLGVAPGQLGFSVWQTLPPDALSYFNQIGQRNLTFRGFEVALYSASNILQLTPTLQLVKAKQAPAPSEGRLLPDPSMVYASFSSTPLGVFPAGAQLHVALVLGQGQGVTVPAGDSIGSGLCAYVRDYQSINGSNGLLAMYSPGNESGPPYSLSGVTLNNGQSFWNDQLHISNSTPAVVRANGKQFDRHELEVTYLFDEPMVQPLRNATVVTLSGWTMITADDGRGAFRPGTGDVLSYSINSHFSEANPSITYECYPMVMYEDDVAGTLTDPAPENWVGNFGGMEKSYIFDNSYCDWWTNAPPHTGTCPDVTGLHTAIWLGKCSSCSPVLTNSTILANSTIFETFPYSGSELLCIDTGAPWPLNLGTFGRNLIVDSNGDVVEQRTQIVQQRGFCPLNVPIITSGGQSYYGLFEVGGLNSPTTKRGFYLQMYLKDLSSGNIAGVSNAFKAQMRF
ncbi:MAG: hypothetical protein HY286_17385 [Planctomycetes bacterium]|nr:hypothetical protein [Planctomycetota bacterium]